ncbi:MAG TPA: winged helix-turn-helix domain-containing protein [Gemmatimonadaceae bacterium]|nr:winged helix-turn-helix domain-containing protein [Gemmatimonadaceae bacterium]
MPTAPAIRVLRGRSQAATLLHDTRRELIEHLAEPDTAAGLARKLGTSRQRLRYHLRQLEAEGLVECIAERRNGNCVERVVRATARAFVISPEAIGKLGDTADTAADRFSAAYLMGSAARTVRDVAALDARAKSEGKRLATITLESDIRFASPESRAAFAEELTQALARLTARYHDERAPNGRMYRLTALAHPAPPDTASRRPAARAPEIVQSQADGGGDDDA